ncbi:Carbamoyl-phosphate synthase [ammonia], mitochondrial [Holothuria leucospilota]|uniref:Carbamoyl-phosphate synthase [ammonia], mitochondrial n=1 Tax=Holothuria leucospilota TaxID=206669 RepID=A0A9Q1BQC0_HOLLE|nr:Carbamoyl-phosphate synthase [ammonia], mitochondrial [Holothuria leucospilota]
MQGQTALNCGVELFKQGILQKHGVRVMAIGPTFEESLQRALRMIHPSFKGFAPEMPVGKATPKNLEAAMEVPSSNRIYAIAKALEDGYSVDQIHQLTSIDKWFLHKLQYIMGLMKDMKSFTW